MPVAGQLWMPCSQTTTCPVGRLSERGTAPLSSCDSNPTPTLHQQTWRIRTTPKASASEGRPLAIFEGTRKDPGYEMDSQQKQIRQEAIILSFPPWCFLHWKLTFKWQHRTPPQTSIGLHTWKSRLTVVANTTVKMGQMRQTCMTFVNHSRFFLRPVMTVWLIQQLS